MQINTYSFADLPRLVREKRGGRTFVAVARDIGVDASTVARLLQGHNVSSSTVAAVMDWLGLELAQIEVDYSAVTLPFAKLPVGVSEGVTLRPIPAMVERLYEAVGAKVPTGRKITCPVEKY